MVVEWVASGNGHAFCTAFHHHVEILEISQCRTNWAMAYCQIRSNKQMAMELFEHTLFLFASAFQFQKRSRGERIVAHPRRIEMN